MRCVPPSKGSSSGILNDTSDLDSLVRLYRIRNRPRTIEEIDFFWNLPTIDRAIHHAALACDGREKRYGHQNRIRTVALHRSKEILLLSRDKLKQASNFRELHSCLKRVLDRVSGLGELYLYDTAFRLGAFFGYLPGLVYLHRGTREGAKALGIDASGEYVRMEELPMPIRRLVPHEAEDFLCIFADKLKRH